MTGAEFGREGRGQYREGPWREKHHKVEEDGVEGDSRCAGMTLWRLGPLFSLVCKISHQETCACPRRRYVSTLHIQHSCEYTDRRRVCLCVFMCDSTSSPVELGVSGCVSIGENRWAGEGCVRQRGGQGIVTFCCGETEKEMCRGRGGMERGMMGQRVGKGGVKKKRKCTH